MASRRKLKKTIQFIETELITEINFRLLMNPKADVKTAEELILEVSALATEYRLRVNHPAANANSQIVKSYYRSIFKSWSENIAKLYTQIEKI